MKKPMLLALAAVSVGAFFFMRRAEAGETGGGGLFDFLTGEGASGAVGALPFNEVGGQKFPGGFDKPLPLGAGSTPGGGFGPAPSKGNPKQPLPVVGPTFPGGGARPLPLGVPGARPGGLRPAPSKSAPVPVGPGRSPPRQAAPAKPRPAPAKTPIAVRIARGTLGTSSRLAGQDRRRLALR